MSTINIQGKRLSENVAREALRDEGVKPTKANVERLVELSRDKNGNDYLSKNELSRGAKALVKELGGGTPASDLVPTKPLSQAVKLPPASQERYQFSLSDDKTVLTIDPRQPKNLLATRAAGAPKAKSVNVGHTFLGGVTVSIENAKGETSPFKDGKWVKRSFAEVVTDKADLKRLADNGYDVKAKRDILVANTEDDKTPTLFALRDSKLDQNAPEPEGGSKVKLAKQDLTRGFVAICTELTIEWFGDRPQFQVKKPVVYLYPREKTSVKVVVEPVGEFSAQYPRTEHGTWQMVAMPDGTLFDPRTEKKYSYLFWEADHLATLAIDVARAHCVRGDDAERFLDDVSMKLGLNDKERTDFVSFWVPALSQNPLSLVQLMIGAEVEAIAKMTVTPRPDAELRLFMMFQRVPEPVACGAPAVPMVKRTGFTVVEWGGVNLDEVR
jgi:hypothetical protein